MQTPTTTLTRLLPAAGFAVILLAACGDDEAPAAPSGETLTYWGHVAPILQAKCVHCHREDGLAPFRLDSYQQARRFGLAAADATRTGIMPPYLLTHDGSCGQVDDRETLTEAQRQTIWDWAHGNQKEGTPVTLPAPSPGTVTGGKDFRTPTLTPVAQGGQLAEVDEYRCFAVDGALSEDAFITSYEVLPGTPALVHHVIAMLVDPDKVTRMGPTNAEVMAALDAKDPDRPGWTCFGAAGEGVEVEAVPVIWAPGQGVVSYPEGVGVQHRKQHRVVIQMHYNLADPRVQGQSDVTTVRFGHSSTVRRRGVFVVEDGLLDTLFNENEPPATLEPGLSRVPFTWRRTGRQLGLEGVPHADLIGVMPHMHERGVSKRISLGPAGAAQTCTAEVKRWDFHWQKFYFYKAPLPRLTADSELEIACQYDTSKDRAAVTPGWGTRNEMCTAILMLALPEGM